MVRQCKSKIKTIAFAASLLLAASALANSAFDWTGTGGAITIPAGVAAEVLDEDIAAVEALTSIVQADATSQIVFKNTTPLTLAASITGPGGGNTGCHNVVMDAASQVTFNGNLHFTAANTYFTLGNCTVNAEIGGDGNYYHVKALDGCTVTYSSTAQIIRRYFGYFYGPGTHYVNCAFPYDNNQSFVQCSLDSSSKLVFGGANLNKAECITGSGTSNTTVDLNGYDLAIRAINGGSTSAKANPAVVEVTSKTPASLTYNLSEANHHAAKPLQNCSVIYTGAISLNVATSAAVTNTHWNGISTTTGSLDIASGTLAFAGNAQWTGPTVNVTGGRLSASAITGSLSLDTDLSVSGTGVVEVPAGSTLRVRSLTVDGEEVLRNAGRAVASLAADYPGRFEGGGTINALQPFIYVDDASGDDVNNDGRSAVSAFKTIKHALEAAEPGDTILVAPGVYGDEPGDEVMGVAGDWSRIVIPEGVTVRATGSATNTVIVGKTATEPKTDGNGNSLSGADSARCVYLNANSRIEGFTLTGGCATWGASAVSGGGVYAANAADCRIVGCIISNCYAATTASAGNGGCYLRCRFSDCNKGGSGYGYCLRNNAKTYNCFFVGQTDGMSGCNDAVYCTFYTGKGNTTRQMHNGSGPLRGCVFMNAAEPGVVSGADLARTICVKLPTAAAVDATCAAKTWAEIAIADNGAPTADSAAIDFGDTWEDYLALMLAAGWTEEEATVDFAGNPRCRGGRLDAGCCEYDEEREISLDKWYVDDATGSDANDGRNRLRAKKTLKAALESAANGETVIAAPGVYGDEEGDEVMGTEGDWSRIVIPDGVTVKAAQGPENTVIVGRRATEVLSGGGCGTDSARCVYLNARSHIEGFTLTGGYSTQTGSTTKDGGGFCSQGPSYGIVVNCVVSNNVASNTGGSGYGGRCFGCRFYDNTAVTSYGMGLRCSNAYNCILKDSNGINGMVSVCYALVNCTVINPGASGHATMHSFTSADAINCVFVTDAKPEAISGHTYRNCLFTTEPAAAANVDGASRVVTAAELALDGWGVPSAKTSAAVGAGSYEAYAAAMASFGDFIDVDALGLQRVRNGALDVGGAEYDWRVEYARDLGSTRWLRVDAASSNVVETAAGAVRLVGGSSIVLSFSIGNVDGKAFVDVPFAQDGAGTLTATLDGEAVEPEDGRFVIRVTAAKRTLVLSFDGEGSVVLAKMRRRVGFMLIVQ